MKLSIPFNGQNELISRLRQYPEVKEVYGKLTSDFIGGGKHSFQIAPISKSRFAYNVKKTHDLGLEFNYLLNSSCIDNAELTISGQRKITALIDWLVRIKVDAVTVATPYLLALIKKRYPSLKIYVSDLAYVDTLRKARYWEELGANRITLFNIRLNRDFPMLKLIRKNTECQLKLILNSNCLYECPYYLYHANMASHASQSGHTLKGFVIDYCRVSCRYRQLTEPVNFIRSTWIRPEDVEHYEKIGIDYFKIIDRGMTTQTILSIVTAYVKRNYNGNILDLFPNPSRSIFSAKRNLFSKAKYFLRPFAVNLFRLRKFAGLSTDAVYIDNKKLDGFIEKMMNIDCRKRSCQDCSYCHGMAEKIVHIDKDPAEDIKRRYGNCLRDIIPGSLFRYTNPRERS